MRIAPLTLTLPFALLAYLFVAHMLAAPDQALAAALLAGTVTALVGMFCVGLVSDMCVVPCSPAKRASMRSRAATEHAPSGAEADAASCRSLVSRACRTVAQGYLANSVASCR